MIPDHRYYDIFLNILFYTFYNNFFDNYFIEIIILTSERGGTPLRGPVIYRSAGINFDTNISQNYYPGYINYDDHESGTIIIY